MVFDCCHSGTQMDLQRLKNDNLEMVSTKTAKKIFLLVVVEMINIVQMLIILKTIEMDWFSRLLLLLIV